jgi:hypothetical protein
MCRIPKKQLDDLYAAVDRLHVEATPALGDCSGGTAYEIGAVITAVDGATEAIKAAAEEDRARLCVDKEAPPPARNLPTRDSWRNMPQSWRRIRDLWVSKPGH